MSKVAKNLKKFRVLKNMTQDALAEKLFVTRQTVSGWENNRTQPDIDMLCKISDVLEVSVEDLIYGEKRFSTAEESIRNRKKMLVIIFSVLACVLTGVGLVFIFVTFWTEMPDVLKGVFAFVPMLAGQLIAAYAYVRHHQSVAWREGASILWCTGMTATVALINTVFDIDAGFANCLLVDLLMVLPVIYLMDVASPLIVYYSGIITYNFCMFERGYTVVPVIVGFVLFTAGLGYVMKNISRKEDPRHLYTVWISVIAGFFMLLYNVPAFESESIVVLSALTVYFISIYLADKNNSWTLPFAPLGIPGLSATTVTAVFLCPSDYGIGKMPLNMTIAVILFSVCMLSLCVAAGLRSLKNNIPKLVCISFGILNVVFQIAGAAVFGNKNGIVYALIVITSLGVAVAHIVEGALSGKFLQLNAGIVSVAVITGNLIYRLIDIGFLATGIMLLVFGLILFSVNLVLARKMKMSAGEVVEHEKQK